MSNLSDQERSPSALVVEDNFYIRQIFHIALESAGYIVNEVDDGVQSIAILSEKTFDLLVLDLQMPFLDGSSILKLVRANPLHTNMRVIVVTANAHVATDDIDE